ncbi:MAG: DCC1-like thiol-disulfide oxidoreductase family protein [Verrucomicrobiales bacterium]|nr:DCC1-like thiol-disulfide oxidoreductase family protein [Verrucomicrobiales bacterium]
MTETTNSGELYYDGSCRLCTGGIERLRSHLERVQITCLPFENGANESEMKLQWIDRDQTRLLAGADAAILIAHLFWFTRPFALLFSLPGLHQLAHFAYRVIAKNRHCLGGTCQVQATTIPKRRALGWLILLALVAAATLIDHLTAISDCFYMVLLCTALWISFKTMMFRTAGGFLQVHPLYFAWIGMATQAFHYGDQRKKTPLPLFAALSYIIVALLLALFILPKVSDPLILGWLGIALLLSIFHFGLFTLLAQLWRRLGFPVDPIMNAPWAATTLSDFWGARWNRAFSDWARLHIFRPIAKRQGTTTAIIAVFAVSGLVHEVAISLPARAGYGLPTLYFLIQVSMLLMQKGFTCLQNKPITLLTVLVPAPILFHPAFITQVIAPILQLFTH